MTGCAGLKRLLLLSSPLHHARHLCPDSSLPFAKISLRENSSTKDTVEATRVSMFLKTLYESIKRLLLYKASITMNLYTRLQSLYRLYKVYTSNTIQVHKAHCCTCFYASMELEAYRTLLQEGCVSMLLLLFWSSLARHF